MPRAFPGIQPGEPTGKVSWSLAKPGPGAFPRKYPWIFTGKLSQVFSMNMAGGLWRESFQAGVIPRMQKNGRYIQRTDSGALRELGSAGKMIDAVLGGEADAETCLTLSLW